MSMRLAGADLGAPPEAWRCRWRKASLGCMQQISLILGEGNEEGLCLFHWKVTHGLIDARTVPLRPTQGLNSADVISDEQLEIGHLLRQLGASRDVVGRALAKDRRVRVGASGRA